ncbi:unnamed protein product [Lactuca virosa]|uniref:Uncharacterized protein n=1 Tax=Lactuca virosa TaxID=75947 RepID=A0AAU9N3S7_9ASTR|nr:unnamed protein product [Lactuca virosa]
MIELSVYKSQKQRTPIWSNPLCTEKNKRAGTHPFNTLPRADKEIPKSRLRRPFTTVTPAARLKLVAIGPNEAHLEAAAYLQHRWRRIYSSDEPAHTGPLVSCLRRVQNQRCTIIYHCKPRRWKHRCHLRPSQSPPVAPIGFDKRWPSSGTANQGCRQSPSPPVTSHHHRLVDRRTTDSRSSSDIDHDPHFPTSSLGIRPTSSIASSRRTR